MEANCENDQFKDQVEAQSELKAESCNACDGNDSDGMRQCGAGMRPCNRPDAMRPPMGNCGGRPCGMRPQGMRPGMYPGRRPGNVRPGGMRPPVNSCGDRPCGARPCESCSNGLPAGWRPSDGMRSNSYSDPADLHSDWNLSNRTIQDSYGNSMTVGCEGQTMTGCRMNDPMYRLGDAFPPVMAYVPWQQWGDVYDPECGLKEGTIFKDLNYIFCGTRC